MSGELAQQREPSGDCSPSPATELAQQREPSGDCSPSPATAAVWTGAADPRVRYFLSLRAAGSGTALCVCVPLCSPTSLSQLWELLTRYHPVTEPGHGETRPLPRPRPRPRPD